MKINLKCIASCILLFHCTLYTSFETKAITSPIPYVDFDTSMQKAAFEQLLQQGNNQMVYNFFKYLYELNSPLHVLPEKRLHIPKKLHFIWLGRPMPEEYNYFINTWREMLPDFEFKLWTEADVETFPFKNKDIFDEANNYSRKADIWCLEILEQEGGLYLNVDFECLKRDIETLHYTYDFYIAMQPLDTNIVQLGTGLIASIPHHPLLQYAIEKIRETRHVAQIIVATGPIFFTQCYFHCAQKTGYRDIAFPASYFYPCGYTQRGQPSETWHKDEAYAVHHWAGSWLTKEAFVPGTYK